MEFVLYCIDMPGRAALRRDIRPAHLEYVGSRQERFRYGGPLLDEAGEARGSLMILDVPDRAALDAHIAGDPFFSSDLFESVTVWASRQVLPERGAGGLRAEMVRRP
jgi:uncharacterized protein YciI